MQKCYSIISDSVATESVQKRPLYCRLPATIWSWFLTQNRKHLVKIGKCTFIKMLLSSHTCRPALQMMNNKLVSFMWNDNHLLVAGPLADAGGRPDQKTPAGLVWEWSNKRQNSSLFNSAAARLRASELWEKKNPSSLFKDTHVHTCTHFLTKNSDLSLIFQSDGDSQLTCLSQSAVKLYCNVYLYNVPTHKAG